MPLLRLDNDGPRTFTTDPARPAAGVGRPRRCDLSARWLESGQERWLEPALQVYRDAFTHTRIADERVHSLLDSGLYRLALVTDADQVQGMALVALFGTERFAHLDYIATHPDARGRGVATKILRFLQDALPASGHELLTLEVEDHLLQFYGQRGALLMEGVPYLFPGESGPLPMSLLAIPYMGQKELSRDQVTGIVRALYLGIHGRDSRDSILNSFIGSVPTVVRLTSPQHR